MREIKEHSGAIWDRDNENFVVWIGREEDCLLDHQGGDEPQQDGYQARDDGVHHQWRGPQRIQKPLNRFKDYSYFCIARFFP